MSVEVLAPCGGQLRPVAESVDPVFAQQMVGPGVLIDPEDGRQYVLSPVSGRVVKAHPHAFVVLTDAGFGVLVHLGIDTVKLDGEGFELITVEGHTVVAGDRMVRWDPTFVASRGLSPQVPVVVMDRAPDSLDLPAPGPVSAKQPLFTVEA